jgi:hypothetical protein
MKASYVVIVAALLGSALGGSLSWARFSASPPLQLDAAAPIAAGDNDGRPQLIVDDYFFDFGAVERDSEQRHTFHFTNAGQGVLTLKAAGTTCSKCTIAELKRKQVAPGETVDVTIVYLTSASQPEFRQQATIVTNDPDQPRVELKITGSVTSRFRVVPEVLALGKVSTQETRSADIKVYGFVADSIELAGYEFTEADSASFFEVKSETLPADQWGEPQAKCAMRVVLTLKPGLPLGPIRQTIRLNLRLGGSNDAPTADVMIIGTIDSNISIVGPDWNADKNRLRFGVVKSAAGATRNLRLLVRGDHRHAIKITPSKLDPEWLKVSVGEPSDLPNGTVTMLPLTIEIPPGSLPENRRGSDQGKYAEIVLDTTDPEARQIRIYLDFVVTP